MHWKCHTTTRLCRAAAYIGVCFVTQAENHSLLRDTKQAMARTVMPICEDEQKLKLSKHTGNKIKNIYIYKKNKKLSSQIFTTGAHPDLRKAL